MARNLKQLHRLSCQCLTISQKFSVKPQVQVRAMSKFTSSGSSGTTLNSETAFELVLNLDETERTALKTALNKLESNVVKQKLEGKLLKIVP